MHINSKARLAAEFTSVFKSHQIVQVALFRDKQAQRAFLLSGKRCCSLNEHDTAKAFSLTGLQHYVTGQELVLLAACNHSQGATS